MAREPIGLAPGAALEAAGQDEKKYSTTNPVVIKLLERWLGRLRDLVGAADPTFLVDVGVGEGIALARTRPVQMTAVGIEYREDKLREARSKLDAFHGVVGDAGMLPIADRGTPLVTCIEVLEHLTRPDAAVAEIARITSDRCIVSVPWEPWFRLGNLGRGKNLRRLGNDPEHIQAFSPSRLRRLLSGAFEQVEVHRVFPWLVAVASRPR